MNDQSQNNSNSDFLKTDGGKTKSNAIEVPSISLPKGGGAIKGIDEKFSVNAVNGSGSFSIPLPVSSARAISPSIGLSYSSGSGNGTFGLGWNLSFSSIKRKTDKGLPKYIDSIDSDTFLFSEAEDLVAEFKKNPDGSFQLDDDGEYIFNERDSLDGLFEIRSYIPRIEGLFARIERWTEKASGRIKWRIITGENTTTLYGWTDNSIISDPTNPSNIFEWLPEYVFDDKGNCHQYIYKKENEDNFDDALLHNRNRLANNKITYTNQYLDKVLYGNKTPYVMFNDPFPNEDNYMFQTVFDYGTTDSAIEPFETINTWDFRPDAFSNYRAGFEIRTTRLCKRVLLFHVFEELALKPDKSDKKTLIKSIDFEYDVSIEQDFTFLTKATSFGYIKKADGSYSHKKLPPMEFIYQEHDWNKEVKTISSGDTVNAPSGIDGQNYQFTDLFNEGLSGILTEQGNGWYYKHNLGDGKFEVAKLITPKPSFTGFGEQLQLVDLDADGGKQLVSFNSEPRGYFELNDENEWMGLRTFKGLANIDFSDANTRLLDLNGDGKPEIIISEDNVFTWYESEGRDGYAAARKTTKSFDEEEGPHLVFSDAKQTIFLADMSGDGMTDILRIRNGEVCYWPNLGYGKFGTKVAIDNAPTFDHPDAFNPAFIRLADIDGSGTSDIIYLGKNMYSCWKNLSGNSFSTSPFEIDSFPEIHSQANITVTDLLGNGVACIVWSSQLTKDANAPLRYIDLMNSKKPHIMVSYANNMGKEVSLEYTPSTKFYIEDKLAGKPWVTKLHIPIHCVSKTTTEDKITGHKFVSEYKYHHGYYDHAEREFRGFGMVEQTDAETFEHWEKSGATNITDVTLHQEPVVSKSWHHTGAFLQKDKILNQFADDYWYEEMQRQGFVVAHHEVDLPDSRLVTASGIDPAILTHLSPQEWQEALRACKGMALRSETFAKDAVKFGNTNAARQKELTPFSVATHNCVIELLQPKGKNQHAVFIVKESEAITYNYERNPEDPRIAHNLNLQLDEYGNILESASVVYPRLIADASLPLETQQAQSKTIINYTKSQFTNDVSGDNTHRLRLPSEIETYELKSVVKAATYYSPDDFTDLLLDLNSDTADYHELDKALVPGKAQKRLIEHLRTIYYQNDLISDLPLHQLESLALPFESYQLAYTPQLITDIFGTKVNAAILAEGKFTASQGDNNSWIRSGTSQFKTTPENIADAQNRFYSPISYTDPYGAVTKVKYYGNYFLFLEETEDALGNKSGVEIFNFRTLSPNRMKDINGNFSEAILDELGFVKASALFGKGNEADDLIGLTEITEIAEQNDTDQFFGALLSTDLESQGKILLKHATARFVYDFDVYKNTGKPIVVASILREEHFQKNNNSDIQLSFEYSSGLGEVVMKKMQADPGTAKEVVVNPDNSIVINLIDTDSLIPKQLRWVGNGRTIVNNKGKTVKQYEPYFSVTWHYEAFKELVETGVTPIMYYDGPGRLIKTEVPDGTFSKVKFDSWKQVVYDSNDTVLDPECTWYINRKNNLIDAELIAEGKDPAREKVAAEKAAKHADTPMVFHFDTLGRPILSIEHNKNRLTDADEFYRTKINLDTESNLRSVNDGRELPENGDLGNKVIEYKYDMLGNMVYQNSMDGGQRWPIGDIFGKPLRTWDERDHEFQYFYDILHRPTMAKVLGGDSGVPFDHIFDRIFYGETELNPETKNLRGAIVKHYDTGGVLLMLEYDFTGQPITETRKLFKNYKSAANWIDANLVIHLENEEFTTSSKSDAFGRVIEHLAPDGNRILNSYNKRGLLASKSINHVNPVLSEIYIKDIDYNENGLRSNIVYGNDVSIKFYYDKETFRLKRLESKKKNNDPLQDWYYTFDPIGNITHVEDKNIPLTFFNNQKTTGISEYTYDAMYRLITATGRENDAALNFNNKDNWDDAAYMHNLNSGDAMLTRNYTQHFEYDEVGNMLEMAHVAAGNNWTRTFNYEKLNNRLASTQVGAETYNYNYHAQHGFMIEMAHLEEVGWNFKEEMLKSVKQKVTPGNGTAETTYYQYDGQGYRIRKITENFAGDGLDPTKKEERIYIFGYETYKKYSANVVDFERQSLSLIDGEHRFVMIDTVKINTNANPLPSDVVGARLPRYQMQNHFGSSALELDSLAQVISYEEYHPFGTTAYQAHSASIKAAAKHYRYTGMERDDETGLEYHSARYYIPWLGRWSSVDPIGINGGINDFAYCINNPINRTDTSGKEWCWNAFADDCSLDTARIFGGLKVVGGVFETAAGVAGAIATAPACVSVVGCVAPVASGAVALHGLDTIVSGARTVWEGEAIDSGTSQLAQAAGVPRNIANLGDATISVVGTLGTSALVRAPAVAAPAIAAETGAEVAPAVAPSISVAFRPALGPGHNMVGVTTEAGTSWTHLVTNPQGFSALGTNGQAAQVVAASGPSARYITATVQVTAPQAQAALTVARSSRGGAGAYAFFANDCATHCATVARAAGVSIPATTSPLVNFTAAALQSPAIVSTIGTTGAVVNTVVGVEAYTSQTEPANSSGGDYTSGGDYSSSVSSEYNPEENVCYQSPDSTIDYSQMVCQ